MKLCTKCGERKPLEEFSKDRSRSDGLNLSCKECGKDYRAANAELIKARKRAHYAINADDIKARVREYYAANAESIKAQKRKTGNLKIRYGLTVDDYDRILDNQSGQCANPGCANEPFLDRRLNVDHDHACCPGWKSCGDCVRGLLCSACNSALGYVDDDIARLAGLIEYLTIHARDTALSN